MERDDAEGVSAAQAAPRLSPEAAKVHSAASNGFDQGLDAVTSRLPSLVFRTPDRQGGTYHLAYTHDSADGRPEGLAFVHLVALYPDTGAEGIYDTARVEEGTELAVEPLKQEYADGFHTEHLRIRVPDDMLVEHAAAGLYIQVSSARAGTRFTLEVPSPHIEALLALRFPEGLAAEGGADTVYREAEERSGTVDAAVAPVGLDESAIGLSGSSLQTRTLTIQDPANESFQHSSGPVFYSDSDRDAPSEYPVAAAVDSPPSSSSPAGLGGDDTQYVPTVPLDRAAQERASGPNDPIIVAIPDAYADEPGTRAVALAGEVAPPQSEHRVPREPVSVVGREPNTRARMGPWAILAALGLLVVLLVWRFAFFEEQREAPMQTQTPPEAALPQNTAAPALSQDPTSAVLPAPATAVTPATPASPPPPATPPVSARRAAVARVVDEWFKTGNRNPGNAMRFYAPTVDYYRRGYVSKAYVEADKRLLVRRWPVRDNRIEGAITVTENNEETRATFLFSYWLENGKQIRNGRARVLLSLQQRDGRYYIVRENAIALDAAGNAQNVEFYWRHELGYR